MQCPQQLIVTCEHAVNTIPNEYQYLFKQHEEVHDTHRAIDFGALSIAQYFSHAFKSPLITASVSRLFVECNRSPGHSKVFSEFTKELSIFEKQKIMKDFYIPYRQQVEELIEQIIEQGKQVIHLSMHSFTPIYNNIQRNADICLLYDPRRAGEKQLAALWRARIKTENPDYRVRMNYPYSGISDGLVTYLRKRHTEKDYLGIEVESNQSLVASPTNLNKLTTTLVASYPRHSPD